MRHVWILNHYAVGPDETGSTRHYSLAKYLASMGWEASIIASSVEHATSRQRYKFLGLKKVIRHGAVRFVLLKNPSYRGNGIGRILNILSYTVVLLLPGILSGLSKPDVIIGSSVHPLSAWAGKRLAKRFRIPFVFEVRDLWPATLVDMGLLSPGGVITSWLSRLEKRLARQAAFVLVLPPRAVEYYQSLGVDSQRILALPNGAYVSSEEPPPTPDRERFLLMYCGAMGKANSLDTLLESLQQVEREWSDPGSFACRLVGDGPMRSWLVSRARELGLKSVTFEPSVPKSQVVELLKEADACVITLRNLPRLYRFGVSMNKIFDYMAAGRPIIMAADVPENPVALSKGGVVVLPESPGELAGAILNLAQMPKSDRDAMGQKAWRYVLAKHHYRSLAERLGEALDRVVAEAAIEE